MLTANYNFLFPNDTRRTARLDYFSLAVDPDYLSSLEIEEETHIPAASMHYNDYLRQRRAPTIQSTLTDDMEQDQS